jgi:hypothetical protein
LRKFTDANGREWSITINVGTAKRVLDLAGVDIFKIFSEEATRLFSDPILLVNTIYVLVSDQCKGRDVTDAQFGEALVGDAIESAADALMQAVADFFPLSRRLIAQKTIEKSKLAAKAITDRALMELDKLDPNNIPLNSSTKLLAS